MAMLRKLASQVVAQRTAAHCIARRHFTTPAVQRISVQVQVRCPKMRRDSQEHHDSSQWRRASFACVWAAGGVSLLVACQFDNFAPNVAMCEATHDLAKVLS